MFDTNSSQVSIFDGIPREYRSIVHGPAEPGALGCLASLQLIGSGNVAVFLEQGREQHAGPVPCPLFHKEEFSLVHRRYDRDDGLEMMREVSDLDEWNHKQESNYEDSPPPFRPPSMPSLISATTESDDIQELPADVTYPDLLSLDSSEMFRPATTDPPAPGSILQVTEVRSLHATATCEPFDIPELKVRSPSSSGATLAVSSHSPRRSSADVVQESRELELDTPIDDFSDAKLEDDSDHDDPPLVIDLGAVTPTTGDNSIDMMEEPSPCPTPGSPYAPSDDPQDTSVDAGSLPMDVHDPDWIPPAGASPSVTTSGVSTPELVGLGRGCLPRPAYRSVRQILRKQIPDATNPSDKDNTDGEVEAGCRRNDRDGK